MVFAEKKFFIEVTVYPKSKSRIEPVYVDPNVNVEKKFWLYSRIILICYNLPALYDDQALFAFRIGVPYFTPPFHSEVRHLQVLGIVV